MRALKKHFANKGSRTKIVKIINLEMMGFELYYNA